MAARVLRSGGRIVSLPELAAEYAPRDSLRALSRQYLRYGMYRAKTGLRHPWTVRPPQWPFPGSSAPSRPPSPRPRPCGARAAAPSPCISRAWSARARGPRAIPATPWRCRWSSSPCMHRGASASWPGSSASPHRPVAAPRSRRTSSSVRAGTTDTRPCGSRSTSTTCTAERVRASMPRAPSRCSSRGCARSSTASSWPVASIPSRAARTTPCPTMSSSSTCRTTPVPRIRAGWPRRSAGDCGAGMARSAASMSSGSSARRGSRSRSRCSRSRAASASCWACARICPRTPAAGIRAGVSCTPPRTRSMARSERSRG